MTIMFQIKIIVAWKHKEIKIIAEGRGPSLKAKEFPELSAALEYAFGVGEVEGWRAIQG